MKIRLQHPQLTVMKECPVGFSWTVFFFGWLVPLIRGWYGYSAVVFFVGSASVGLAQLFYFPFVANKKYILFLLEKGYQPASQVDVQILNGMGIQVLERSQEKLAA